MTSEQAVDLLSKLDTVIGLLYIVGGILLVILIWGMFKACQKFWDMFF